MTSAPLASEASNPTHLYDHASTSLCPASLPPDPVAHPPLPDVADFILFLFRNQLLLCLPAAKCSLD